MLVRRRTVTGLWCHSFPLVVDLVTMSDNCFSCALLVLDGSDEEEAAHDATLADKVTSGIGGLTILSSHDDASWVVAERPLRP